jgi:hypothetical protein
MKRLLLLACLSMSVPVLAQDADSCRLPQISLFGYCVPIRDTSFHGESRFKANVENTTMLNPDCPVTLMGIYFGQSQHNGTPVSVHFANASERKMIAVKLGLTGFDAALDPHEFAEPYAVAVDLKPQKKAEPIWRVTDEDFEIDTASGARVYVDKVVFANGATWQDDGTKSCSLTIRGIAHPRPNDE